MFELIRYFQILLFGQIFKKVWIYQNLAETQLKTKIFISDDFGELCKVPSDVTIVEVERMCLPESDSKKRLYTDE